MICITCSYFLSSLLDDSAVPDTIVAVKKPAKTAVVAATATEPAAAVKSPNNSGFQPGLTSDENESDLKFIQGLEDLQGVGLFSDEDINRAISTTDIVIPTLSLWLGQVSDPQFIVATHPQFFSDFTEQTINGANYVVFHFTDRLKGVLKHTYWYLQFCGGIGVLPAAVPYVRNPEQFPYQIHLIRPNSGFDRKGRAFRKDCCLVPKMALPASVDKWTKTDPCDTDDYNPIPI